MAVIEHHFLHKLDWRWRNARSTQRQKERTKQHTEQKKKIEMGRNKENKKRKKNNIKSRLLYSIPHVWLSLCDIEIVCIHVTRKQKWNALKKHIHIQTEQREGENEE